MPVCVTVEGHTVYVRSSTVAPTCSLAVHVALWRRCVEPSHPGLLLCPARFIESAIGGKESHGQIEARCAALDRDCSALLILVLSESHSALNCTQNDNNIVPGQPAFSVLPGSEGLGTRARTQAAKAHTLACCPGSITMCHTSVQPHCCRRGTYAKVDSPAEPGDTLRTQLQVEDHGGDSRGVLPASAWATVPRLQVGRLELPQSETGSRPQSPRTPPRQQGAGRGSCAGWRTLRGRQPEGRQ
jgi:hypothetical protein